MTYATQHGLIDRYGEAMLVDLTDRSSPPEGFVDAWTVKAALEDTDALIDVYLAGRYRLPLGAVPRVLETLAEKIAVYKLHAHVVPEKIDRDYRDAVRLLEKIASGEVTLREPEGAEPPTTGAGGVRATDRERPLSPGSMKGFI